jgi:hypothetical protein
VLLDVDRYPHSHEDDDDLFKGADAGDGHEENGGDRSAKCGAHKTLCPRRVDCCNVGSMATRVASGIQSALVSCSPKAMATAPDTAMARITTNKTIGRLSFTGGRSSGISGSGDRRRRDSSRSSHKTVIGAIAMAAPISQASAWFHGWYWSQRAARPRRTT